MHDITKLNEPVLVLKFVEANTPNVELRTDILRYFHEVFMRVVEAMRADEECDPVLHYRAAVQSNRDGSEPRTGFSFVMKYDGVVDGGFVILDGDDIVDFMIVDSDTTEQFQALN